MTLASLQSRAKERVGWAKAHAEAQPRLELRVRRAHVDDHVDDHVDGPRGHAPLRFALPTLRSRVLLLTVAPSYHFWYKPEVEDVKRLSAACCSALRRAGWSGR